MQEGLKILEDQGLYLVALSKHDKDIYCAFQVEKDLYYIMTMHKDFSIKDTILDGTEQEIIDEMVFIMNNNKPSKKA